MSSPPEVDPQSVPPGVIGTPQGDVVALGANTTQDYARLVFSAPRFEVIPIAEIIQPSVTEAVQAVLPSLVPPYVNQAAQDAVNALAVRRVGDTMTGPLNLSPAIPTAPSMAATKQYVDLQVSTVVPEVPPVPAGGSWARQTGQWVPLTGGGSVTNIATTGGITGGPITTSGTIQLASMGGNTLKGNNTGATAAPADLTVAQVMTMLGAAPLNSPAFSGTPQLPTGTAAVTQPGGTNNTSVATTAFVANTVAAQLVSPAFTGNPTAPTPAPGDNDTSIATTAFVATSFAPLASPVFSGAPSLPTGTVGVTQTAGNSTTALATTAFVATSFAPLASPVFTGAPSLPAGAIAVTAAPGDNDTSVATTAFVAAAVANYLPLAGGRLSGGLASGPVATTVPGLGNLTLNANTVAPSAAPALATTLWSVQADNSRNSIWLDSFGPSTANYFAGRNARGTAAAPTATQSGDTLVSLISYGYGTAYAQQGQIQINASENWTGSARGTQCTIFLTPNTTTAGVASLTLDGSGNLTIAGATATKASGTTWANPSARDLKQNIHPYSQGLQAVLALQPRTWDFAADSGIDAPGPHIGLIHDETGHMPEMHRTATIGGGMDQPGREVDALDCSAVTWALVNAVKTLNERLTVVEGRAP